MSSTMPLRQARHRSRHPCPEVSVTPATVTREDATSEGDFMAGRLTLSWVNKDQALVPDDRGGYTWVDRDDPRVTEVRLLHSAGGCGKSTSDDNLLIQGDSYDALHALVRTPEYARRYRGKVKLVYIDPPFNTRQAFEHYEDALEHSVWLGMMRERLLLIRELLTPDGSVWVHLDDAEMAYCRVLMDEIFGRNSFVATVTWQKRTTRENRAAFSSSVDYILVYCPSGSGAFRDIRNRLHRSGGAFSNPDNDPRGPWTSVPFTAQGYRPNQMYKVKTPTGVVHDPPTGRCWGRIESEYIKLLEDNRIYFPDSGNGKPRVKKFEYEDEGLVPDTLWTSESCGTNDEAKRHIMTMFPEGSPFDTPKPERLLQRVIHIGSSPGDVVLDCFAGSGTTLAVAHKLNRRWVGVELSERTVQSFIQPRLERVVAGEEAGGITNEVEWFGGGSFRCEMVGPSLYERARQKVLLADWAKGDDFAQAVAAQLGFTFEIDTPFCGRKGRTRLAVVDGVADDVVVRAIVSLLGEDERATVVAKATAPGAAETLRELSRGSRLLKAPQDLVRQGKVVR